MIFFTTKASEMFPGLNWAMSKTANWYKAIFLTSSIFFCSLVSRSQNDTLIFNPIRNQILQNTEIRNFSIAKDGKLWLSTNKGIASFDGNEVKFFGHKESDITTMWSSSISFLNAKEDRKGNLYVVTISGPTYYFDTKTGKTTYLEIESNNLKNYIPQPYSDLYIENDTSIWLARYNGRFLHYEASSKKTAYYNITNDENSFRNIVTCIRCDGRSKELLWLATKNGIYSFHTKSGLLERNFKCSNVKDSSEEDIDILNLDVSGDTIWFTAGRKGVGCYDIQTGRYTIFPCQLSFGQNALFHIKYFQRKSRDEYYVGTEDKNPGSFNINTHQYSFKTKINGSFPSLQIGNFLADSSGNCWCLIFGQLFYAGGQKNKFLTASVPIAKSEDSATSIFKKVLYNAREQCYYAAFDRSDKILVFDSNIKFKRAIPILSGQNVVTDIGFDRNSHLWMTGDRIFLYDSAKGLMQSIENFYHNIKLSVQKFQNIVFRENYLYTIPSNPSCNSIYRINTTTLSMDSIPLPDMMLDKKEGSDFGVLVIDSKSNYAYISNKRTLYQYDLENGNVRLIQALRFESMAFSLFSNFHWYETDDNDNLWVSSNGVIRVYEPKGLKVVNKIIKTRDVYLLQSANFTNHAVMGFVNSGGVELFDYKNNKQYKLGDGMVTKISSGIACANNILFVGGQLNVLEYIPLQSVIDQNLKRTCYLSNIQLFNNSYSTDTLAQYLSELKLPHNNNYVSLTLSSLEFEQPEKLEYRYKLDGVNNDWVYVGYLTRTVSYTNLSPGKYSFHASVKNDDGSWSNSDVYLPVIIIPAWWQTTGFKIACIVAACSIAFALIKWRIKTVRNQEQERSRIEKELLELEAKALRAQMNPHFIFNCMNSIKSLIQQDEKDKATTYLITFSKLIRTIFQNSDKREITLYDEIETCRLYTQLESMRFNNKFSYEFVIDEALDLKSVMVPALIIQPFIENAIWHGIMPKEDASTLTVKIIKTDNSISCIIDDDGVGRAVSMQNKFNGSNPAHQSKGVSLTQTRLELSNVLNQRHAAVEIIDKANVDNESTGTKVVLVFNEE
jgi:hypothetical protein